MTQSLLSVKLEAYHLEKNRHCSQFVVLKCKNQWIFVKTKTENNVKVFSHVDVYGIYVQNIVIFALSKCSLVTILATVCSSIVTFNILWNYYWDAKCIREE